MSPVDKLAEEEELRVIIITPCNQNAKALRLKPIFHVLYMQSPHPAYKSPPHLRPLSSSLTQLSHSKQEAETTIPMAKTAFFTAFLAALLVASHVASAYHTTITTVNIDEENPRGSESCRQQMEKQQGLNQCVEFLRQSMRGGRGTNPQQMMEGCCRQLRGVQETCRCEALKEMMQDQQMGGRREEMQEMMDTARRLPSMCGMKPQECQFRAEWA